MSPYTQPSASIQIPKPPLESWPLPDDWILEGAPDARGAVLSRSDDSRLIRGVWECTPGRFTWQFSYDETLVVVAGRATVEVDTGERVELEPGSMAFFGRGHDATW